MSVSFKRRTAADWLVPSADLTELIRRLQWSAGHSWRAIGAVATFSDNPDTGGAPAAWIPAKRELLVNAAVACPGQAPEDVRIGSVSWRRRNRRAMGMILHEAGHAAFTPDAILDLWNQTRKASPAAQALLQVCEETRMERLVIGASEGAFAPDLRACATDVILRDMPTGQGAFSDSLGMVLTCGRSTEWGGALEPGDIAKIKALYSDAGLPVDALLTCAHRWYVAVDDVSVRWLDPAPRVDKALRFLDEWCKLLEIATDDADAQAPDTTNGEGDGEPEESSTASAVSDALEEGEDGKASAQADADAADEADEKTGDAEIVRKCAGQRTSGEGFEDDFVPRVTESVPDIEDRRLAAALTREFQRIATPDIRRATVRADLPPGRWNSRAAVQREAETAAAGISSAREWNQRRRSSVRVPPPVVGVIVDVSGSMSAATAPMASLLWALGESARAIQARFYAAHMGNAARPYDHDPRRKLVAPAEGGTEEFGAAFLALDERLHFSTKQRCARLLLIVSDGMYTDIERVKAAGIIRHISRLGVTVVWCVPPGCRAPSGYDGRVHLGIDPRSLAGVIAQEIRRDEKRR